MRIALIGGTGLAGRHTTEALCDAEHDAVVISRFRGVDVFTGNGLDQALSKVEARHRRDQRGSYGPRHNPQLFCHKHPCSAATRTDDPD